MALAIAGTMALILGLGLAKIVQARHAPRAQGPHTLIGQSAQVRADDHVFVNGELWRARAEDGTSLEPGGWVAVTGVDEGGLTLVVGSAEPASSALAERT